MTAAPCARCAHAAAHGLLRAHPRCERCAAPATRWNRADGLWSYWCDRCAGPDDREMRRAAVVRALARELEDESDG